MAALSEVPCELHELPWCAVCSGRDQEEKPEVDGPPLLAQYPGNCACCGQRFAEGTEIAYSIDAAGWVILSHSRSSSA